MDDRSTDDALAGRLADDLDASFEALVRAHQDRLYSLALRALGDPGDAEEVTQDAFVRAYRALAGYDAERRRALQVRAWLSTILLNLARNHARRFRPAHVALERLGDLASPDADAAESPAGWRAAPGSGGATRNHAISGNPVPGGSPESAAIQREEIDAWGRRVRALPARYREPLLLRYVDELAYSEISAVLQIPEGTLRAQVHRGLALLRAALERESGAAAAPRTLRLQEVGR